jgi:hypothetical protein
LKTKTLPVLHFLPAKLTEAHIAQLAQQKEEVEATAPFPSAVDASSMTATEDVTEMQVDEVEAVVEEEGKRDDVLESKDIDGMGDVKDEIMEERSNIEHHEMQTLGAEEAQAVEIQTEQ